MTPIPAETLARLRELLAEAEAFDGQHGCLSHLTSAECAGCAAECALTEALREHACALLDAAEEREAEAGLRVQLSEDSMRHLDQCIAMRAERDALQEAG